MITRVRVIRYKGFSDFSLSLSSKAVLVGPNSAGKTTIAQALRLASVVLRHAQRRNSRDSFTDDTFETIPRSVPGYPLSAIGNKQISWYKDENLRYEFRDKSSGIEITFKSKARLRVVWPERDEPFFYIERLPGMATRTAAEVLKCTPSLAVVPTLGPVEHREEVLSSSYVRESLGTRLTSRHFRNQLYHLRQDSAKQFEDLEAFILSHTTEVTSLSLKDNYSSSEHTLDLFFTESSGRSEKEVNWLGDGMQVWLQVLFHVWSNLSADTLVLDEPDVYLHPDLQRRLVGIIEDLPGQTLIATHAPEIITEVGRDSVIWIDRSRTTSQRTKDSAALEQLNTRLGSGFNLGMARALRSRVVLFVEGEDAKVLRTLARTLRADRVCHERGLAAIPLGGFSNWHQVEPFAWMSRDLLGDAVTIHVVLDSDYRSARIVLDLEERLKAYNVSPHVWRRKELESYILVPEAMARLSGIPIVQVDAILANVLDELQHSARVNFVGRRQQDADRHLDGRTVMSEALQEFEAAWFNPPDRVGLVAPKEALAQMSLRLKDAGGRSFSPMALAKALKPTEIPAEMADIIMAIERDLGSVIA